MYAELRVTPRPSPVWSTYYIESTKMTVVHVLVATVVQDSVIHPGTVVDAMTTYRNNMRNGRHSVDNCII